MPAPIIDDGVNTGGSWNTLRCERLVWAGTKNPRHRLHSEDPSVEPESLVISILGRWFDGSTTQAAMIIRWLARLVAPLVRMGVAVTRPQISVQQ